ncbi:MAG: hypothetical protein H0U52_05555 [Chloroflexi bacterium]|nr:hypothetical protein [Chloroflexota bacterium]
MTQRPISLTLAAALLILIGLSGLMAGGGLLWGAMNGSAVASDVRRAGLGMGSLIAAYALAAAMAGTGLVLGRRWAWRLGLVVSVVGLVALGAAMAGLGDLDAFLLVGVAIWGATAACLFAPATRRAMGA